MTIDLAREAAPTLPDDAADLLFRSARTVREFVDRPVDDATVAAAWDLAKWGPTALNTSPLRLVLVRTAAARARLADHMAPGNRDRVLAAPLAIVATADDSFHRELPRLAPHLPGKDAELAPLAEQRARMARDNALLQVGYLILALRAVGLAVAPMGGMDAPALDADLLGGTDRHALVVLNVGYVEGDGGAFPRAPRLELAEAATTL